MDNTPKVALFLQSPESRKILTVDSGRRGIRYRAVVTRANVQETLFFAPEIPETSCGLGNDGEVIRI